VITLLVVCTGRSILQLLALKFQNSIRDASSAIDNPQTTFKEKPLVFDKEDFGDSRPHCLTKNVVPISATT